jgi:ABC-type branched-subunit amino acid transport system substrate-binding protein
MRRSSLAPVLAALLLAFACDRGEKKETPTAAAGAAAPAPEVKTPGVDPVRKVIRIGALNDESGPGAGIGKPYALGKRMLVRAIAEGGVKILPEGWTVELVEKDHAYNPQQSVQHYNAIKDEVLFIATSFGTPNTLPLRPMLERDKLVAFPASLASDMAENHYTPPLNTSYKLEAMRAMDWVVEQAGDAARIKAAVVYQQDDYGKDGQEGWLAAAKVHNVTVVDQQAVAPGQKDYAAVVASLKEKGATHVLLTTLPSSTAPILGTATQLGYTPVWIGSNPAWIDRFFDPQVVPPQILANFYWATPLAYWGEELPGMKAFLDAYEKYGKALSPPNHYLLISYAQGIIELEAAARALQAGPLTRESYLAALKTLKSYDAQGISQPLDMTGFPYVPSTRSRVLKPRLAERTWEVVAGYAVPRAAQI